MHGERPEQWRHDHDFIPASHHRNERQTRFVIALTAMMMVVEIFAGSVFNSMALLADGWHMGSHASALGITAFAYWFARRHRNDGRFSFGTGKIGVLGGFSSAVVLAIIALLVAWGSVGRLFEPLEIGFDEAISVAVVGLLINLFSAWLLRDGHDHASHEEHHHDHNLRAAYLHVLADALTSVTAILGLTAGKFFGWIWMDPLMGIIGSLVIARWSYGLLRDTSAVLVDAAVPKETINRLHAALETDSDDLVADLHVWRVGPGQLAVLVSVVSDDPQPPEHYRSLLARSVELAHVTVEVIRCPDHALDAA
jgi:cation diffusion facilitator family transporter